MEGWQKGAEAVLKMSGAGKENYFRSFPERKEWFQSKYPEHFGRSVAKATTSLKTVTKAKVKKQRLAAIRQAAEKRDQLKVSSDAVRAMGVRRRESGEGLAGGMDTVSDIKKTIAAGMPVRSGGLGSLYEAMDSPFDKVPGLKIEPKTEGNTKQWCIGDECYATEKEAQEALDKATPTKAETEISDFYSNLKKLAKGELTPEDMAKSKTWGQDWPKSNPDWGTDLGMADPTMSYDPSEQKRILQMAPAGAAMKSGLNQSRGNRKSGNLSRVVGDVAGVDYRNQMKEAAASIAARIIEEKRVEECMSMGSNGDDKNWDDMKTWRDNPISKMSKSEAEDEPGEYDYEGDMAKSQLRSIMHNSKMLHDMLEDNTNLPEWVQSKLTLAEDYILTAANYMRGEMDRMDEEVEQVEEKYMGFKAVEKAAKEGGARDPAAVAAAIGRKKYGKEKFQAAAAAGKKLGEETEDVNAVHASMERQMEKDLPFDPNAERPEMPEGKQPAQYRYVRNLARKAMNAGIAAGEQPMTHDDLVAQHMSLHNPQGEMMEEAADSARKTKDSDLVKRSMLPDRSVIPQGKGFGDDLKKKKIMKKIGKALQKKRMALPTDNPSENELVPQSMLPDVPGYPVDYQMQESVAEEIVEQIPEQTVQAEESSNPFVVAGSKFLTRTSTR